MARWLATPDLPTTCAGHPNPNLTSPWTSAPLTTIRTSANWGLCSLHGGLFEHQVLMEDLNVTLTEPQSHPNPNPNPNPSPNPDLDAAQKARMSLSSCMSGVPGVMAHLSLCCVIRRCRCRGSFAIGGEPSTASRRLFRGMAV